MAGLQGGIEQLPGKNLLILPVHTTAVFCSWQMSWCIWRDAIWPDKEAPEKWHDVQVFEMWKKIKASADLEVQHWP